MMYNIENRFLGLAFNLIKNDSPKIKGATNLLSQIDARTKVLQVNHFSAEHAQNIREGVEEIRDKCRSKFFYWIQATLNPFSNAYKIENYAKSILLFVKQVEKRAEKKAEDYAKLVE